MTSHKLRIYPQEKRYTCGAAVVRILIQYYTGTTISEKTIEKESKTTAMFGMLPSHMARILSAYTAQTFSVGTYTSLAAVKSIYDSTQEPIILLYMIEKKLNPHRTRKPTWRWVHYCIVTERTATHIHIINPFWREDTYTHEESIKRMQLRGSPYIWFLEKICVWLWLIKPCTVVYASNSLDGETK